MKIIITEQQYSLLIKQNINEDFLDRYGEGVDNIVEVLGNLMNKMGVGRFIDKYGNFVEKVFGSISNFFKKLRGGDDSINEQNTPEEWKEDIRTLERKFGNPSGWTMDEYYQMQQKLNDYKKWRETTPEGRAVVDMSNKPNEYVVPLPKHLKPVMESRLVKKNRRTIKENHGNRYSTISHWIDMLEKSLDNYDSIDCENITKEYERFYCENLGDYPMEKIIEVLEKLKKEQIELIYNQFDDSFGK